MADENAMWRQDPIREGWRTCELCGEGGYDVRPGLARVVLSDGSTEYSPVTRCKRPDECKARCLAAGNAWPLA